MSKPIVAIVGRQNVGKSTLLNHLAGKRVAIVDRGAVVDNDARLVFGYGERKSLYKRKVTR